MYVRSNRIARVLICLYLFVALANPARVGASFGGSQITRSKTLFSFAKAVIVFTASPSYIGRRIRNAIYVTVTVATTTTATTTATTTTITTTTTTTT